MEFMNVVRMEIKPGQFDAWREVMANNFKQAAEMGGVPGMLAMRHVKIGENKVCVVGRWESKEAFVAARPMLVQNLDKFRHLLVPSEAGDTDPVAGEVIFSATDG